MTNNVVVDLNPEVDKPTLSGNNPDHEYAIQKERKIGTHNISSQWIRALILLSVVIINFYNSKHENINQLNKKTIDKMRKIIQNKRINDKRRDAKIIKEKFVRRNITNYIWKIQIDIQIDHNFLGGENKRISENRIAIIMNHFSKKLSKKVTGRHTRGICKKDQLGNHKVSVILTYFKQGTSTITLTDLNNLGRKFQVVRYIFSTPQYMKNQQSNITFLSHYQVKDILTRRYPTCQSIKTRTLWGKSSTQQQLSYTYYLSIEHKKNNSYIQTQLRNKMMRRSQIYRNRMWKKIPLPMQQSGSAHNKERPWQLNLKAKEIKEFETNLIKLDSDDLLGMNCKWKGDKGKAPWAKLFGLIRKHGRRYGDNLLNEAKTTHAKGFKIDPRKHYRRTDTTCMVLLYALWEIKERNHYKRSQREVKSIDLSNIRALWEVINTGIEFSDKYRTFISYSISVLDTAQGINDDKIYGNNENNAHFIAEEFKRTIGKIMTNEPSFGTRVTRSSSIGTKHARENEEEKLLGKIAQPTPAIKNHLLRPTKPKKCNNCEKRGTICCFECQDYFYIQCSTLFHTEHPRQQVWKRTRKDVWCKPCSLAKKMTIATEYCSQHKYPTCWICMDLLCKSHLTQTKPIEGDFRDKITPQKNKRTKNPIEMKQSPRKQKLSQKQKRTLALSYSAEDFEIIDCGHKSSHLREEIRAELLLKKESKPNKCLLNCIITGVYNMDFIDRDNLTKENTAFIRRMYYTDELPIDNHEMALRVSLSLPLRESIEVVFARKKINQDVWEVEMDRYIGSKKKTFLLIGNIFTDGEGAGQDGEHCVFLEETENREEIPKDSPGYMKKIAKLEEEIRFLKSSQDRKVIDMTTEDWSPISDKRWISNEMPIFKEVLRDFFLYKRMISEDTIRQITTGLENILMSDNGSTLQRQINSFGNPMKVYTAGIGKFWNAGTKHYSNVDQERNQVGLIPDWLQTLVTEILQQVELDKDNWTFEYEPQVVIVNIYEEDGSLGMHADLDEEALLIEEGSPVIGISFGNDMSFVFKDRFQNKRNITLRHGDVIIFGKTARKMQHGIRNLKLGTAPKNFKFMGKKHIRVSITIRHVQKIWRKCCPVCSVNEVVWLCRVCSEYLCIDCKKNKHKKKNGKPCIWLNLKCEKCRRQAISCHLHQEESGDRHLKAGNDGNDDLRKMRILWQKNELELEKYLTRLDYESWSFGRIARKLDDLLLIKRRHLDKLKRKSEIDEAGLREWIRIARRNKNSTMNQRKQGVLAFRLCGILEQDIMNLCYEREDLGEENFYRITRMGYYDLQCPNGKEHPIARKKKMFRCDNEGCLEQDKRSIIFICTFCNWKICEKCYVATMASHKKPRNRLKTKVLETPTQERKTKPSIVRRNIRELMSINERLMKTVKRRLSGESKAFWPQ